MPLKFNRIWCMPSSETLLMLPVKNPPHIEYPLPFIKLLFENHSIIINTDTDELFTDGDKLDLSAGKAYEPDYCRPSNTKNWQKRRIATKITSNHVIVIDVGWDGRVFILCFTKTSYNTFRGRPAKQYSYWNNGSQKAFYEDDLSVPVWTKTQHETTAPLFIGAEATA